MATIGSKAAELRVDADDAIATLKKYVDAGQITDKTLKDIVTDLDRMNKKMGEQPAAVKPATDAQKQFNEQLGKTANISGQSRNALIGLNYIIQDMPYGLRGIGNNLDMTVQQMIMLTQTTGGWKNALTSLTGAITGPVGIMLGFSALISVMQMVQNYFQGQSKDVKDLGSDYGKLIDDVRRLQYELKTLSDVDYLGVLQKRLEAFQKARSQRMINGVPQGTILETGAGVTQLDLDQMKMQKEIANVSSKSTQEQLKNADKMLQNNEITNKQYRESLKWLDDILATRINHLKLSVGEKNAEIEIKGIEQQRVEIADRLSSAKKKQNEEEKKTAREMAELEDKRAEARLKSLQSTQKASTEFLNLQDKLETDAIANKFDRQRREAENEYSKNLADIQDLAGKTLDFDAQRQANAEALSSFNRKMNDIALSEQDEILRKENERYQKQMQQIDKIGAALHAAFGTAGDDFIRKLLTAFDIAKEIASISGKPKGRDDSGSILDFLPLMIQGASLFAKTSLSPRGGSGELSFGSAFSSSMISQRSVAAMNQGQSIIVNGMNLQGTVSLQDGQLWLRTQMPGVEKFRKQKKIDA